VENMENPKYEIEIVIDDICFADYYNGHGHAFEPKSLKACTQFYVSVDYTETIQEIINGIMENINNNFPYFLTENENEQNEIISFLENVNLEKEIISSFYLPENPDLSKNFFSYREGYDFRAGQKDIDEDMREYPSLIGYMHISKVEE
jgi:hypothetical protein